MTSNSTVWEKHGKTAGESSPGIEDFWIYRICLLYLLFCFRFKLEKFQFWNKIPPNGELRAFTCTAIAEGQIIMLDKSKDNDKNCGGLMFIVIQNRKMFSVQRFAEKTTI